MSFDGFHLSPQEILDESCSLPIPGLASELSSDSDIILALI